MYSDVIVPMDGSPFSEMALKPAIFLAAHGHAALLLLRVHESHTSWDHAGPEWDEFIRNEEQVYLEGLADLRRSAVANLDCEVIDGPPARAICERAKCSRAAVIVMSTHGRTGLRRSWLGSVADGVMRHSSAPVLMLRPSLDTQASVCEPSTPFGTVIIALDGSSLAEWVIPHALDIASASGASALVLRVVEPIPPRSALDASRLVLYDDVDAATAYVERLILRLRRAHPSIDIRADIDVSPSPAESIRERARHSERPLVALASHGRGVSRLVLGSVTDSLLRDGPRAVLVIRAGVSRDDRQNATVSSS